MPRGFNSLAEYYRFHREAFELALATGCTPREAGIELRRRATLRRATCGTRAPEAQPGNQPDSSGPVPPHGPFDAAQDGKFEQWDAPWMLRE